LLTAALSISAAVVVYFEIFVVMQNFVMLEFMFEFMFELFESVPL